MAFVDDTALEVDVALQMIIVASTAMDGSCTACVSQASCRTSVAM